MTINEHKAITKLCFNMMPMAAVIMFVLIFYTAYASPAKAVIVAIDFFGEADIEAFLFMPVLIFSGVMSVIFSIKETRSVIWEDCEYGNKGIKP